MVNPSEFEDFSTDPNKRFPTTRRIQKEFVSDTGIKLYLKQRTTRNAVQEVPRYFDSPEAVQAYIEESIAKEELAFSI